MKFKISKVDEFIIINHYPEPYYEGEEPEGDSMVIEENDLDVIHLCFPPDNLPTVPAPVERAVIHAYRGKEVSDFPFLWEHHGDTSTFTLVTQ